MAQPIPVFSGLCKVNKYLTDILKYDSSRLGLFLSLDAWLLKNIFPCIQKVCVSILIYVS